MCTTIIEEEWRDIAGYEGIYQVSNLGRVKSLNYHRTGKENILKPGKVGEGYLQVGLWKNGKCKHTLVHRLVVEAFIPNTNNNTTDVNHKDENKENNRADNLEWCNKKYNSNYGTCKKRMLEHRTGAFKEKMVYCVETGKVFPSLTEAERQTGVNHSSICNCCRGKYGFKTAGGYHWKYCD